MCPLKGHLLAKNQFTFKARIFFVGTTIKQTGQRSRTSYPHKLTGTFNFRLLLILVQEINREKPFVTATTVLMVETNL